MSASVFLLDEEAGELVFEAVTGEGSDELVGKRFPGGTGVAGSVLATGQPLILEEVTRDPRFSREVAESTGYVPATLMAVPLVAEERAFGVLEVLDPRERGRSPLAELELLGLFANQAAIALELLVRGRRARAGLAGAGDLGLLARLASSLDELEGERREAGRQLLASLAAILRP